MLPLETDGLTGSTARHKQEPHIVGVVGVVAIAVKGTDNLLNFRLAKGRNFERGHRVAHLRQPGKRVLPACVHQFVLLHPVAKVIQDDHLFLNGGGRSTLQPKRDKLLGLPAAKDLAPKIAHLFGNRVVHAHDGEGAL